MVTTSVVVVVVVVVAAFDEELIIEELVIEELIIEELVIELGATLRVESQFGEAIEIPASLTTLAVASSVVAEVTTAIDVPYASVRN